MENQSDTQIAEYSKTAAGLAELRSKLAGIVYTDIATTKGMDAAKRDRAVLRGLRTDLEDLRKQIKAPVLERASLIDAEAKRLNAAIVELEEPIAAQIKAEEDRKAAEKDRKAEEERQRLHRIHAAIDEIRRVPQTMIGKTSVEIAAERNRIAEMRFVEGWEKPFEEYGDEARSVRDSVIITLADMQTQVGRQEEEAKRLTEERLELARLREAEAKRKADEDAYRKAEDERRAKEEADRKAAEKAEADRKAAEERARRDAEALALAEERRKLHEATAEIRRREEAVAAEKKRIADEEARKRQEERAAELARIEAEEAAAERARMSVAAVEKRPSDVDMVLIIAAHYNVEPLVVLDWIGEMNLITLQEEFEAAA